MQLCRVVLQSKLLPGFASVSLLSQSSLAVVGGCFGQHLHSKGCASGQTQQSAPYEEPVLETRHGCLTRRVKAAILQAEHQLRLAAH